MSYEITASSPKAMSRIKVEVEDKSDTFVSDNVLSKYPFSMLKIGESFTVPIKDSKEASLRITATAQGKKQNKKFTVIKHKDYDCIEVARIA